jgi:hypothetical protein
MTAAPLLGLVAWLVPAAPTADPCDVDGLQALDLRLTEARLLLCTAEGLIAGTIARHRPAASGPAAAVELDLLAERLGGLPYGGAGDDAALVLRAAIFCAGEEWGRLVALLAPLRLRVALVCEAMADTAVRLNRLQRSGPALALAPSPEVAAFEAEEDLVNDELRRRTAKAGADSAYAAADGAFLPSLAEFLS